MHFAILGTDPDILRLAASARELGHEISWCGDIRPEDAAAIGRIVAADDRHAEWELLLDRATADGVLVGHGSAPPAVRADQLKRLAAEAVPLLVVHPIFGSVLPYYEIDMTRRETGAIVQHYNQLAPNPAAEQLAEWILNGHPIVGAIHQVACERRLPSATRANVLGAVARDVELLAIIAGDIRRVTAVGPAALDPSFVALHLQMTSTRVPSLRWSIGSRMPDDAAVEIVLVGERGTVQVRELTRADHVASTWQLEIVADQERQTETFAAFVPAAAAVDRFATSIRARDTAERGVSSTWDAATRSMEVVDATELSLQKGRTIEVFQQQLTEKLAFRGTMAALGCGLLLVVFFAVVAVAVLGGAEGIVGEKIVPAWPLILLGVLAVFLLLQAVPLLIAKKGSDAHASDKSHRG